MDRYNVLQNLGRGTFGTVYLCERKHNKLKIVVKEVFIDGNEDNFHTCKNEILLMNTIAHPNVIRYYDSFMKNSSYYIVMEYASGGTLYHYINNTRHALFEREEVMRILCQILLALNHIHSKKIAHRDLKSENIFLTGSEQNIVKIGDFGISKALSSKSNNQTQTQIGTTNYMAPEVWDGKAYNTKCDIWALGCLLYELCTKSRLFEGSVTDISMKIKAGQRKFISFRHYGAEIQQIIDACLHRNPDYRPTANALLAFPQIFPHVYDTKLSTANISTKSI